MRVVPRDDSGAWLVREPTEPIFEQERFTASNILHIPSLYNISHWIAETNLSVLNCLMLKKFEIKLIIIAGFRVREDNAVGRQQVRPLLPGLLLRRRRRAQRGLLQGLHGKSLLYTVRHGFLDLFLTRFNTPTWLSPSSVSCSWLHTYCQMRS